MQGWNNGPQCIFNWLNDHVWSEEKLMLPNIGLNSINRIEPKVGIPRAQADNSRRQEAQNGRLVGLWQNIWSVQQICKVGRLILLIFPLYCSRRPVTERLVELTYLVGQNDLSGRLNRPLIGRPRKLDMSNILAKNPDDLLISWSL